MDLNNPKGASFKENNLMTTARDALRTMFIFRFSTLTHNLNLLNPPKTTYTMTCDSKINLLHNNTT